MPAFLQPQYFPADLPLVPIQQHELLRVRCQRPQELILPARPCLIRGFTPAAVDSGRLPVRVDSAYEDCIPAVKRYPVYYYAYYT